MRFCFTLILFGLLSNVAIAAPKVIPDAPREYIYDETNALSASARNQLFQVLSSEDQKNSNQVLVAVFKSLDEEDVVDFTNRVFQKWQPGDKKKSTGALLAFYLKEHKIRIEVGYGLEATLTDARSKRIIIEEISPSLKQGHFDQGVLSGIQAILSTIHQEKNGTPPTHRRKSFPRGLGVLIVFFIFWIISRFDQLTTIGGNGIGTSYHRRSGWGGGGFGGWGGGSSGGSGGGGFSGGGGMSGGGGAGGDW